ncbi:DUF6712 family protein [Spirosoma oryzicola]|uniref:DUF6712 family protein n=1 Tax=Spirosoma oryzicola TaxID=2898794 RepID=UPI001E478CF0|nr:DUF6712 family protein [Spirosoma oryzicola]UHG93312.1 hypothetical protein LQ777_10510 [Spirosoma oryzicola]
MILVTTSDQFAQFIGALFDKEIYFNQLEPFVVDAQEQLIEPLLGSALIEELENPSVELLQQVRRHTQKAIVWAAFEQAQVSFLYQFGNAGLSRFKVDKSEKLAQWEIDTILADTAKKADTALEQLMDFLTTHQDELPTWTNSTAYRHAHQLLIPTTVELRRALPEVAATHSMLVRLQLFMPRTERRYVRNMLGDALFDELTDKRIHGDTLTREETELLSYCRQLLAPVTLWEALPTLNVIFQPDGIRIISSFKGLKDQKAVNPAQVAELRAELWKQVETARGELRTFLNKTASATVFSSYFNSALYVAPTGQAEWTMPDNEGKKHFRL